MKILRMYEDDEGNRSAQFEEGDFKLDMPNVRMCDIYEKQHTARFLVEDYDGKLCIYAMVFDLFMFVDVRYPDSEDEEHPFPEEESDDDESEYKIEDDSEHHTGMPEVEVYHIKYKKND